MEHHQRHHQQREEDSQQRPPPEAALLELSELLQLLPLARVDTQLVADGGHGRLQLLRRAERLVVLDEGGGGGEADGGTGDAWERLQRLSGMSSAAGAAHPEEWIVLLRHRGIEISNV